MMTSRALKLCLAAVVVTLLVAGCSNNKASVANNADGASNDAAKWMSEPDAKGNRTPHKQGSLGPDGTVKVGNATCCVKGYQITPDFGFVYNGWYINYCCMGCDLEFEDSKAGCIKRLKEISGIDVSVAPTAEQIAAAKAMGEQTVKPADNKDDGGFPQYGDN